LGSKSFARLGGNRILAIVCIEDTDAHNPSLSSLTFTFRSTERGPLAIIEEMSPKVCSIEVLLSSIESF
jgi:hypothetical protein